MALDVSEIKTMLSKGMTKSEIAERLGVSRQALYDCLNRNDVKIDTVPKKRGRPRKVLSEQETAAEIVKQRASVPRGKRVPGAPQSLEKYCTATEEELGQMMNQVLKWYGRKPPVSDEECEARVLDYFQEIARSGDKPSMETLSMALGVSKAEMRNWVNGVRMASSRRQEIMDRALLTLQAMDATLVLNRKIPDVTYIYRSKNFYGMKDQTDVVVTPNNPLGEEVSEEELRKRIRGDVIIDEDDFADLDV